MSERRLIVNADDFGLSPGVNRGIVRAHEHGIVTSTSLMVRATAVAEAVEMARSLPTLALGIHVDLGEWHYAVDEWRPRYEVVPMHDPQRVAVEIEAQLEAFGRLVGRAPTHLDSHQHVHHDPNVKPVLLDIGARLGVPVRAMTPGITYNGAFYGQDGRGFPYAEAITVEALVEIVRTLPAGTTELACHPGYASDVDTTYRSERSIEVDTLCDPAVRAAIDEADVRLCSFASLQR